MPKKRHLIYPILLLLLLSGCAVKKQTPQYNAAVGLNDFATALQGVQNLEISLSQTGIIDPNLHKQFEQVFLNAAQDGKLANAAVRAGDFTSAKSYFASAVALLNGLTPQMVGIKNPDSQKAFQTALTVAINIAQTWATNLGASTSATGATQ